MFLVITVQQIAVDVIDTEPRKRSGNLGAHRLFIAYKRALFIRANEMKEQRAVYDMRYLKC